MPTLNTMQTQTLVKTKTQLHRFYNERIRPAVAYWRLNVSDQEIFEALAGIKGRTREPRCSDYKVRYQSTYILLGLMQRHWRDTQAHAPGRRYFFITLIDDVGRTLDIEPQINLAALQAKVDKALREVHRAPEPTRLHGLFAFELQAFNNYPEHGHGKMISLHTHAVAWTDDESFDPDNWADRINGSRSWHAEFDIPPADIKPIESELELARACRYLSKVPADCKNRTTHRIAEWLRRKRPDYVGRTWPLGDGYELVETTEGYPRAMALRLFEGLSQLLMTQMVHGIGDGADIRTIWRQRLTQWHRARQHGGRVLVMDSVKIGRWWARQRIAHGSQRPRPWRFLARSERPYWPDLDGSE